MKKAYFAGGCFWCITPVFYELPGVRDVVSGYSGGEEINPSYEQVKHQNTGHRETVCVVYHEEKVSYESLVECFLANIDPFDEDGQFIDRGASYTTAIYYTQPWERETAQQALARLESRTGQRAAVCLEAFRGFYTAEEIHQNYFRTHPEEFAKELEASGRNAWRREEMGG